jgi:xanthine dehydrogenase YagS FAD-binding subunit
LQGRPATDATFSAAAEAALRDARPRRDNAFKMELARRCIVAALRQAAGTA